MKIKIGKKLISEKSPCFIIAEAGVNHNGSLELAKKLVDAAKEARADAVKFQTFTAENVVTETARMAEYQKKNIGKKKTQLEMIREFELKFEDFAKLKKYCDNKKIIFLSTPHSKDAIDFLNPLVSAFKIGSGDLTNLPFLQKVAKKKKPIILATGMSDLAEVKDAVKTIKKAGNNKIILLHCTTNYPCPIEEVNLKAMLTLKEQFGPLLVGYSDHTDGINVALTAVALGAWIIEKHFTLDKNLPGPDHKASLNPKELKEMVRAIRDIEKALGHGAKKPFKSEKRIRKLVRKSIIAKTDILKGTKILKNTLIIKRPGTGIAPKHLDKIIGKKAKKNIKKDALIKFKDLS
ncbi:MAG: N-acetylneuraminate synthase [Candidatus Pacebacteria bacterium]|nr:N-acetylneuraminate synthase [Candidatus Paceibacterota bacterium]